jgi:hypothetical protein
MRPLVHMESRMLYIVVAITIQRMHLFSSFKSLQNLRKKGQIQ